MGNRRMNELVGCWVGCWVGLVRGYVLWNNWTIDIQMAVIVVYRTMSLYQIPSNHTLISKEPYPGTTINLPLQLSSYLLSSTDLNLNPAHELLTSPYESA
ncbi:hypothetical protein CROQUDRAFT_661445 [Cronartium quercuum f. sp. fusiforme G11]|uniref:Uncharacterized protein n=1 Tax=Cronartium quercuum f. sp. fusiforme G11 TaxID=708437 RepID=A0A9P6TA69_9BASI|nr:hypothetical protein CROQUDRAFT_661445 [Cronartium quercuum f. sp. fusiforme G11]